MFHTFVDSKAKMKMIGNVLKSKWAAEQWTMALLFHFTWRNHKEYPQFLVLNLALTR